MNLPLKIYRYEESYIVQDASEISLFTIYFDDQPGVRRQVRKRLSKEEAEALAKRIARFLTDAETQKGADDPTNGAAG